MAVIGQLSKQTLINNVHRGAPNAVAVFAAGSSGVDGLASDTVDMSGYEGAYFIGSLVHGGTGGAPVFSVRQSTAVIASMTSGGQGTALTGASATLPTGSSATADHGVIDIYRPRSFGGARFLFSQWVVTSSCAVIGPTFVIQYGPRQVGNSTMTNSTGVQTIPQTTASSTATPFLTFGVTAVVSPSS